jgi:putative ABC transport system permease protein
VLLRILRGLARNRAFASLAVGILGVSIGVAAALTIAIHSLVYAPLEGVRDPQDVRRLQAVVPNERGEQEPQVWFSYPVLQAVRAVPGVSAAAGAAAFNRPLSGARGRLNAAIALVTPDYFEVLGVRSAAGRLPSARDDVAVAVLSHRYWQQEFGGDAGVLGTVVRVDGSPVEVVGVADPRFLGTGAARNDVWISIASSIASVLPEAWETDTREDWLRVVTRLDTSEDAATVAGRTAQAMERLRDHARARPAAVRLRVLAWATTEDGDREVDALAILLAGACALLALGIFSVGALLTIRGARRAGELKTRLTLGATIAGLATELLLEAALLALAATAVGGVIAVFGTRALQSLLFPGVAVVAHANGARLAVVLAICAVASIAGAALWPVIRWRRSADLTLREHSAHVAQPIPRSVLALLGAQTAVAVLLIGIAAASAVTLVKIRRLDLGVDLDNVVTVNVLAGESNPPPAVMGAMVDRTVSRLRAMGSVQGVTVAETNPFLSGEAVSPSSRYAPQQSAWTKGGEPPYLSRIGAHFFASAGARSFHGRDFSQEEVDRGDRVAILNAPLARALFPGRSALDECVYLEAGECVRVVGVVDGVWKMNMLDRDKRAIYLPLESEEASVPSAIFVRLASRGAEGLGSVEAIVRQEFGTGIATNTRRLVDYTQHVVRPWRIATMLATFFAVVAVAVALTGVYSSATFLVLMSQRELSVRIALGASRSHVWRCAVWRVLLACAAGVAVAVLGATFLLRGGSSALPSLPVRDVILSLSPAALLMAAALFAASAPVMPVVRRGGSDALR